MSNKVGRAGANQIELAAALGVTDRRIRQLIDDFIIPPAHHETGLFDLPLCRSRYRLYRLGSDKDWEAFYDEAERTAEDNGRVFERAMDDTATLEDIGCASVAVQMIIASMHFLTACRSKSAAERELFHRLWQKEEDQILGELIQRILMLTKTVADEAQSKVPIEVAQVEGL